MGADRMAEVQLDDVAEPVPEPVAPSRTATRARALLRRWWPAPVAVVLALVAAQAVTDRRDEAAAERLRATPGVLAETVTAPLEATPWGTGDAMGLLMSGTRTADGLIAGVLTPGTGEPAAVVALDAVTGEERWRAEIGVLPTEDGYTRSASCTSGSDAPAKTLWCAVTDGPAEDAGPVTTRLVADADALYAARGDTLVAVPTTGALRLLGARSS
ncbi:hypothetical protein FA014_02655 [Cellulomonas hominis]|uniref:Uncharacterized protein n=1 Tax=Cellulomonas hominis TaxID=156981 RepID=A0A7Z8K1E2_9CELL|nr:hypothetical protein [Cellulomonas hominis]TKR26990.1 hypothetical protein FA014_02655 [Cellulomonas hominis]